MSGEIQSQFIILARKDEPTPDFSSKRRTDTGFPPVQRGEPTLLPHQLTPTPTHADACVEASRRVVAKKASHSVYRNCPIVENFQKKSGNRLTAATPANEIADQ